MVIPINTIRYGAGLDALGEWYNAQQKYLSEVETEGRRVMAPARGAAWGLLASLVLWLGLIEGVRVVMMLVR